MVEIRGHERLWERLAEQAKQQWTVNWVKWTGWSGQYLKVESTLVDKSSSKRASKGP